MPAPSESDYVKITVNIPTSRKLRTALCYILKEQAQPTWWLDGEEQAMIHLRDSFVNGLRLYDEEVAKCAS